MAEEQTVYVSIGNTDGKLSPVRWSEFYKAVDHAIRSKAEKVYGAWHSLPTEPWQNACWAFVPYIYVMDPEKPARDLVARLSVLARDFGQDAITWGRTPVTMIGPADPPEGARIEVTTTETSAYDTTGEKVFTTDDGPLLRPSDWEHIFHVKVHDPDGWRSSVARPGQDDLPPQDWDVRISEEEWQHRSAISTTNHRPLDQSFRHNPWDSQCGKNIAGEPTHPKARCRTCNARPEDGPVPVGHSSFPNHHGGQRP